MTDVNQKRSASAVQIAGRDATEFADVFTRPDGKRAVAVDSIDNFQAVSRNKGLVFSVFDFHCWINTNSSEHVGILENPSGATKTVFIDKIILSPNNRDDDDNNIGSRTTVIYVDSTRNSGGQQVTPVNLNRGSSNVSAANFFGNSPDNLNITNGTLIMGFYLKLNNVNVFPFNGSLILPPGKSVHVKAKGKEGHCIYMNVHFWEE